MSFKDIHKLGRYEPTEATSFKDTKQWGETDLKEHLQ